MSNDAREQQASEGEGPLVSIGLPVYNGENYLATAIESVLGQTLRNFEIIVCDNASTDRTQAICEKYARQDSRVRYFRNEHNLGAGPNYDLSFHRSRGTFFKWLAHDDAIAPTYLEKTVARLEENPDAVLCETGITEIGAKGETVRVYESRLPGIDSSRASIRFAGTILYHHQCEAFFGLFRRQALVGSDLHGMYSGSDRVLFAEMALRGRCVTVPEPLFLHRDHNDRYTRAVLFGDRKKAVSWQNTSEDGRKLGASLYRLVIYKNYWRVVRKTIRHRGERWACYAQLVRWWFVNHHFLDVMRNILVTINPKLFRRARAMKRALFGISPPRRGGLPPRRPTA
jgi:glycosyltransferase involved in cell wall biosynthesis